MDTGTEALPTEMDIHAPGDAWPGDTVHDFRWPVESAYKVVFKDGSSRYYPSWQLVPNKILKMQANGNYKNAEVTAVSW